MGETGHNNIAGVKSPYKYVPFASSWKDFAEYGNLQTIFI